jgi:hypothetical protein
VMIPGPQNRQTSVSSLRARVFRMTVRSKWLRLMFQDSFLMPHVPSFPNW